MAFNSEGNILGACCERSFIKRIASLIVGLHRGDNFTDSPMLLGSLLFLIDDSSFSKKDEGERHKALHHASAIMTQ